MSNTLKKLMAGGLVASMMLAGGAAMAADWGDHHGMKAEPKAEKKGWDGGGSMMGFEEGHMTARLRAVWRLNLTAKQRKQIRAIQKELRQKHWELADQIDVLSDDLMAMYREQDRDADKIGKVYGKIFDLRRQMIENGIKAGNKAANVLTEEQKKQWQKYLPHPGWGGSAEEWGK